MKKLVVLCAVSVLCILIAGCGGGGTNNVPTSDTATGRFIDAPVEGITYQSGSLSGITDTDGTFEYEVGKSVTFSIGGKVILGTALGSSIITPLDLGSDSSDCLKIVRILMTLDDNTFSDKMRISQAIRNAASGLGTTNVQELNDTDITNLVTSLGADGDKLVTVEAAESHLAESSGTLTVYASGSYEVWATNNSTPDTSPTGYYDVQNIAGYTCIGTATTTASFSGNYHYYVIAVPTLIQLDAIKLPNGAYPTEEDHSFDSYLNWGNVHWASDAPGTYYSGHDNYIYGEPDDATCDVGYSGSSSSQYNGFVVIANPLK